MLHGVLSRANTHSVPILPVAPFRLEDSVNGQLQQVWHRRPGLHPEFGGHALKGIATADSPEQWWPFAVTLVTVGGRVPLPPTGSRPPGRPSRKERTYVRHAAGQPRFSGEVDRLPPD